MNPLTLYQQALDAVSAAVMADDFAAYMARIDLPYLLCTRLSDFVLTRAEELEPTFRNLSSALRRNGVTDFIRLAREADQTRPDRIEGWHNTHILAGDQRLIAPWATRQSLILRDGVWKFSEAHYPFLTETLPITEQDFRSALRPNPPSFPGGPALGPGLRT